MELLRANTMILSIFCFSGDLGDFFHLCTNLAPSLISSIISNRKFCPLFVMMFSCEEDDYPEAWHLASDGKQIVERRPSSIWIQPSEHRSPWLGLKRCLREGPLEPRSSARIPALHPARLWGHFWRENEARKQVPSRRSWCCGSWEDGPRISPFC